MDIKLDTPADCIHMLDVLFLPHEESDRRSEQQLASMARRVEHIPAKELAQIVLELGATSHHFPAVFEIIQTWEDSHNTIYVSSKVKPV